MKKSWILLVLLTLSALVLVSCTSNADTLPSPSPSLRPLASPSPSALPSPSATAGITTLEDSKRVSGLIKTDLMKLSELSNADVLAAGNMAIVGIQYDTQYQGGLTERLTTMIDQRVKTADKALTVVYVTDDAQAVQEIQKLADQVDKGDITFAELQTRMLEISRKISGGTSNPSIPNATTGA